VEEIKNPVPSATAKLLLEVPIMKQVNKFCLGDYIVFLKKKILPLALNIRKKLIQVFLSPDGV
jgi:hypothetical protein